MNKYFIAYKISGNSEPKLVKSKKGKIGKDGFFARIEDLEKEISTKPGDYEVRTVYIVPKKK